MGATNNIFHGKRRSLFLGILFSSFWSIFLLFRQFSFFLILIQHRYMCSMCCVGLQSDVLHLYFSIGIQIYPRAQCAALACGQGGRYPAADYWPPQIFHPCRSHPCHPCTSHRPLLATWEIAAETHGPVQQDRTRGTVPIWNFPKQVLDNTPGMQHNTPTGCRCIAQGCSLSRGCTRISLQKTSLMPLGPRQAAQKQTWKKLEIWKIYLCQISYIQGTWKREIPV